MSGGDAEASIERAKEVTRDPNQKKRKSAKPKRVKGFKGKMSKGKGGGYKK